jgi:hypothetical protein
MDFGENREGARSGPELRRARATQSPAERPSDSGQSGRRAVTLPGHVRTRAHAARAFGAQFEIGASAV